MPLVANAHGLHHHREGATAMGEKSEDLPSHGQRLWFTRHLNPGEVDDAVLSAHFPEVFTGTVRRFFMSLDSQHDVKLIDV